MNETIKELLKQIPIKPTIIGQNSITFLNKHGDYLEISSPDDDTSYTMLYRLDYKCGKYITATINFFDVENEVMLFMS